MSVSRMLRASLSGDESLVKLECDREVLRFAVSRKMFNDDDGSIADMRRSVLILVNDVAQGTASLLFSGAGFDDGIERLRTFVSPSCTVEIHDGRAMHGRGPTGAYFLAPVVVVDPGQGSLFGTADTEGK